MIFFLLIGCPFPYYQSLCSIGTWHLLTYSLNIIELTIAFLAPVAVQKLSKAGPPTSTVQRASLQLHQISWGYTIQFATMPSHDGITTLFSIEHHFNYKKFSLLMILHSVPNFMFVFRVDKCLIEGPKLPYYFLDMMLSLFVLDFIIVEWPTSFIKDSLGQIHLFRYIHKQD